MQISVVLACYNGEKFIIEQLDSIRKQTFKVDEVIICDDNSTDTTVKLVEEYIEKYCLNTWKLIVNDKNVGWMKNFHSLLKNVNGEIVFFSDQDDIWKENKIEIMYNEMKNNKNIKVLACKADFINSEGNKINVSLKSLPFGKIDKNRLQINKFNNKFIYSIFPGCAIAMKTEIIKEYNHLNVNDIPHDALYWKIATLKDEAYILNLPLISYRIHDSNASSPLTNSKPRVKQSNDRIKEINSVKKQIETLIELSHNKIDLKKYKSLNKMLKFCLWRLELFEKKYIIIKLLYYFKYYKFYNGFRMFCGDIVALMNFSKGEIK